MLGRPVEREDVEPFLWELADWGAVPITADQYLRAAEIQQSWAARLAAWWAEGFDLLATPTVAEPALPLAGLDAVRLGTGPPPDRMGQHMVFTEPFNATGQPALTLPLHWTADGLPVGVQLVAALGREDLLLRVASQLESARPWAERIPPIHA